MISAKLTKKILSDTGRQIYGCRIGCLLDLKNQRTSNIFMVLQGRRTEKKDIPDMVNLMKGYFDFYKIPHPSNEKLEKLMDKLFNNSDLGLQFIAFVDSKPAGFATLYFTYSTLQAAPITVMNDLYVNSEFRSQKVGKLLFNMCREYTIKNNYRDMQWVTATDNIHAQTFYDSLGGNKSSWLFYSLK